MQQNVLNNLKADSWGRYYGSSFFCMTLRQRPKFRWIVIMLNS